MNSSNLILFKTSAALALVSIFPVLATGSQGITGFNDADWNSDDTRQGVSGTAGTDIINSTTSDPDASATTNAAQVAAQIDWIDFLGSRGNLGGVTLSPDGSASGKATVSVIDTTTGFGSTASLLDSNFSAEWRWEQQGTVTEGASFKMGIQSNDWANSQSGFTAERSGEAGWDLILVVGAGGTGFNTNTADWSTTQFQVFAQAGNTAFTNRAGGGGRIARGTLEEIFNGNATMTADANRTAAQFATLVFGTNSKITNTQVGVGSGTAAGLPVLDWLSVSYLNSGGKIDFVDAARYNGTDSDYGNAANWDVSPSDPSDPLIPTAPSATQNFIVDASGTTDLTVSADNTSRSLGILAGTTNLTINSGQTLTLASNENGTLFVESGATANVLGAGTLDAGVLDSAGTLNIATVTNLSGGEDPHPQRDGSGTSRYAIVVQSGGDITLESGADLTVSQNDRNVGVRVGGDGDAADGVATMTIENGATLDIDSSRVSASDPNGFLTVGAWGREGVVNQTGGTVNLTQTSGHSGSFNVGNQGGTGTYNLSGGTLNLGGGNHSLGRVASGSITTPGSGTINLSGTGTLNLNGGGYLVVGDRDEASVDGDGTINQTGGTFSVDNSSDLYLGGYGVSTYNLEGGTLEIGGNSLKGNFGTATTDYDFNLQGGTLKVIESNLNSSVEMNIVDIDPSPTASTYSYVDTNGFDATLTGSIQGDGVLGKVGAGTLNLGGGATRTMAAVSVEGGEVNHQDGTTDMGGLLIGAFPSASTDSDGTLTLTDGTVNVNAPGGFVYIGSGSSGNNTGVLNIDGGILNLGDASDPSTRVDFYAGAFGSTGTATVTQTGGTVNKLSTDGVFHIGNQSSTDNVYNLQGGAINIEGDNGMVLGRSSASVAGNGTLNVSGGTLTFNDGTDLLLGGAQNTEPETGQGTVNQTGGTVSLRDNGSLVIGQKGSGTYNLNGGVLEVGGSVYRNTTAGTTSWNLGGGALRVIEKDFSTAITPNLVATSNSTVDTNGFNAAFENGLSGTGTFTKTGIGDLELGGTTDLSGTSVIEEGQFVVGSSDAGTGTLNLSTGSALNLNSSSTGTNRIVVGSGGTGTLNLDGGDVLITNDGTELTRIFVGTNSGTGTINMSDGELRVQEGTSGTGYGGLDIGRGAGNTGTFAMTGGDVIWNDTVSFSVGRDGGTGALTMSGNSTFSINKLDGIGAPNTLYFGRGAGGDATVSFSDSATFTQTGTQNFIAAQGADAVITQDDSTTSVTFDGSTTNNSDRAFNVGYNGTGGTGTYNLNDGNLTFNDLVVSFGFDSGNTGILNQSGGIITAGGVNTSQNSFKIGGSGTGEYNISGGSASFNDGLTLASNSGSTGTVDQTGGTVTIGSGQALAFGSGTGTYNLDGGTLEAGGANGISAGSGTALFSMGGGTLRVVGDDLQIASSVNTVLQTGTSSSIDTNNLNATIQSDLSGSGNLIVFGGGVLEINGTNTNTGTTTANDAEIVVNGELSGSIVTIDADSRLGGSGTVSAAAQVDGTLAAGNSPGLLTFTDGLTLGSTSVSEFEFTDNSIAGRGTGFDGIDVTGGVLTVASGATLNLVFDGAGSSVDFADVFWDSDQSWLLFDNFEEATLESIIFASVNVSADSLGQSFGPGIGDFTVAESGNDLVLNFAAVPEPAAASLLLAMGVGLWVMARRRRA